MRPSDPLENIPTMIEIATLQGNLNPDIDNFLEIGENLTTIREHMEDTRTQWSGEINIMLWNATGLMQNLDRIVNRMIDEEILFGFVTETWLNPKYSIPSVCRDTSAICSLFPVGFDRGKNGVSILINPKMVKHRALKDFEVLNKDTLNGTYIHVQIGNVQILCIYFPPSCPTDLDIWLEEVFLKCRISSGSDLILLGDFNARRTEWSDHQSNANGLKLKHFMETAGLIRHDSGTKPTFIKSMNRPQDGWSIIDHVFSNTDVSNVHVAEALTPAAGHRPIIGKINLTADLRNASPSYKRLRLEKLKVPEVKEAWKAKIENTSQSLVWTVERLRREISSATSTTEKQAKVNELENLITTTWMNAAKSILGEKVSGKRIIRHEPLSSTALDALEAAIFVEVNEQRLRQLMKLAEKERQAIRTERFQKFSKEIGSTQSSDMMKIISSMIKNRQKQQLALNSSQAALEEYRSHFAKMNKNQLPAFRDEVERLTNDARNRPGANLSATFDDNVIRDVIHKAMWNKSPGISGLTYDILKCGDYQTFSLISRVFNTYGEAQLVPDVWKRALVVPVPKKGDLCQIKNYRPISLTEPLRKIFEHCLLRKINQSAGNSFLTQGGFRTNHCCNDMIVTLQETILTIKPKNFHVAFLDIKAAYDSVDRRILWRRCLNRGIEPNVVGILKQMFDHNSSQVVINGRKSNPFHIESGLLQGSVLSPCLYSIFIDDLAKELNGSHRVKVGSVEINCTMYADDIALFADEHWKLQELLDICTKHAEKNRYQFNASKCESISGTGNQLSIHNQVMPSTDSFKYLGVEMTRKGINHNEFIRRRTEEAKRAAEKLLGMGMNLGGLPLQAASQLYKVFIRPKLEASMCILPVLKGIHEKLERSQCQILRRILRIGKSSSSTICRSILQCPRMHQRLKWLRTRYMRRFNDVLEDTHILKQASSPSNSWMKSKLKVDIYEDEIDKDDAWFDEMNKVHAETFRVTGNNLLFQSSKKLAWFLKTDIPIYVIRPILNWILKRYPGRDPPRCSNCRCVRATQEHIAECSNLLLEDLPNVPARFRPEKLLSTRPENNPTIHLRRLALSIANAVYRSLPDLEFHILSV